jgi:hypothetical protein
MTRPGVAADATSPAFSFAQAETQTRHFAHSFTLRRFQVCDFGQNKSGPKPLETNRRKFKTRNSIQK